MLKRSQAMTIAVLAGAPFGLLLALLVVNPAYEMHIFKSFGPINGMSLLIGLGLLHGLILYAGYRWFNQRSAEEAPPPKSRITLLIILSLFLCSLPSFWITLVYPSMILLMQTPTR